MSGRYIRVFSLPRMLHNQGSPVVVTAGALLKDITTGKILAQIKFRNITDKQIKYVKVKLHTYDMSGAALESIESFSYMDLCANCGDFFGESIPIPLPDAAARSFEVMVLSVVYADDQVFIGNGEVAVPATNEVQETIRTIDMAGETVLLQQQKKRMKLLIIPLVLMAVSVFMFYCWQDLQLPEHIRRLMSPRQISELLRLYSMQIYYPAFLAAFISTAFCIVTSVMGNRWEKGFLFGGIIAVVLLVFQLAGPSIMNSWWLAYERMNFSYGNERGAYNALAGQITLIATHLSSAVIMLRGTVKGKK